jgi:hypothetical protein
VDRLKVEGKNDAKSSKPNLPPFELAEREAVLVYSLKILPSSVFNLNTCIVTSILFY